MLTISFIYIYDDNMIFGYFKELAFLLLLNNKPAEMAFKIPITL